MKKLLYGGDGLFGTKYSVYLAFSVLRLGRKLIETRTSRWMARIKPRSISRFMHTQAVRAEHDEREQMSGITQLGLRK